MGTRSNIIVQKADGKYARIYCHWDGYLEGVGRTLLESYSSQPKAERLVKGGDISSLGPKCSKPKGHSFDTPVTGYTVYYGRDRGEKDTAADIFDNLSAAFPDADTWAEFVYLWDNGVWYVADADAGTQDFVRLDLALQGKGRPHPLIKIPFAGVAIGRHS